MRSVEGLCHHDPLQLALLPASQRGQGAARICLFYPCCCYTKNASPGTRKPNSIHFKGLGQVELVPKGSSATVSRDAASISLWPRDVQNKQSQADPCIPSRWEGIFFPFNFFSF